MTVLAAITICFLALAVASLVSVYSYGRFAKQARGKPTRALPVSDGETSLDTSIAEMLRQHPDQNGLSLLANNLQAFAARVHSARSAGRSLDLQYYYWKNDLTGGLLGKEIIAAAERGVRVRLLLDDINTRGGDSTYLSLDSHPNIEVRLFNPVRNRTNALRRGLELLLRVWSTTHRMHNKAWIADGRLAIVGGRNIGDAYFDASTASNFRDMDLLLLGPIVSRTENIFDEYWNSAFSIPIRPLLRGHRANLPKLKKRLGALAGTQRAIPYLQRLAEEHGALAMLSDDQHFHWTAEATVISDPPEKVEGGGEQHWLSQSIFPPLMSARSVLEIISPYFIPGDEGVDRLRDLIGREVRVSVLTNSLAATDVAAVHGAYARYREALLESGVKLFELKPRRARRDISLFGSSNASLHTKAFTVDGTVGFIGSFNFDPRSASLNTEIGVLFHHQGLAREVSSIFAEQIGATSSYRLTLSDGALLWKDGQGIQEKTWHRDPEASVWRRIGVKMIALLPIESQL
jgi:putative cardiolipin synthase